MFQCMENSALAQRRVHLRTKLCTDKEKKQLEYRTMTSLNRYISEITDSVVNIVTTFWSFSNANKNRSNLSVKEMIESLDFGSDSTYVSNVERIVQQNSTILQLVDTIRREDLLLIKFSSVKGLTSKRNELIQFIGTNKEQLKLTDLTTKNIDNITRTFATNGFAVKPKAAKQLSQSLAEYFQAKTPFKFSTEAEIKMYSTPTQRRVAVKTTRVLRKRKLVVTSDVEDVDEEIDD